MMSTQRWEFTPNYEVHPAVGELHLVDFNLMNIICKWNSKWVEFKMGDHQFGSFTQGIIDLLINTTGEFVTER